MKPHFISVTRGPGIRAALTTGLDTAKGLAVAWQIPLVGVNHMQAHALTARLVCALDPLDTKQDVRPVFPFLSLLVSGGHTLLVNSKRLCDHAVLASTTDIAIGDAIDKMARSILPPEALDGREIMYGRVLEKYAFPDGPRNYEYKAPTSRAEAVTRKTTPWGWSLPVPLAESKCMQFSYSGLGSAIARICEGRGMSMEPDERRGLASEGMRVAFEHLAERIALALTEMREWNQQVSTLVVSGGVASNGYLRRMYVH